ncbi:hypothetical protein O6H91_06G099600 [Diphasiastrum complanatum]|uniref:Uncharacterized protein n=6 Tax=Diphasiastrum complanatum TaxID=34168 RepID=A0ACC2DHM4_DIPCM|nr:hypothetical protein O6H91_06G099600 [Diphasiastrum complanatum]KAJ7553471.1 hypothetical protein O6H91_06G099600 [Diphasiastrum complanatum]KAJ7553472.1 hypothetical protein O6H91_06G099600 [Diphasiastrum complanatum]KAJ7553473.1 hypothetical protein O6H91_06G099600 [Diphasiastrum complanatum]KAJ7553474.1 hypothetical protein O6H91_06G099600 [Diphasiastrum complanatum]
MESHNSRGSYGHHLPQGMLCNKYPCPVGTTPGYSYRSMNGEGEPPLPKRVKIEPVEDMESPFSPSLVMGNAQWPIELIKPPPYPQPSQSSHQMRLHSNSGGISFDLVQDLPEMRKSRADPSGQFVLHGNLGEFQAFPPGYKSPLNNLFNPTLTSPVNPVSGEMITMSDSCSWGMGSQSVDTQLQLVPYAHTNVVANHSVSHLPLAIQPLALSEPRTEECDFFAQQAEDEMPLEAYTLGLESDESEQDVGGGLALSIEASDASNDPVGASLPLALSSSKPASDQCLQVLTPEQEIDNFKSLVKAKKEEGDLCSHKDLRREAVQGTLVTFEELRLTCVKEQEDFVPVELVGFRRRADLKAASLMREKGLWLNSQKLIGNIPGVQVGDTFNFRIELCILGLHRQHRAGIDYITAQKSAFNKAVATSVVIGTTEQYGDDVDMGETVIYTGQGGTPRGAKEGDGSAQDQKLVRGNIALKNSFELHIPVRVIRGHRLKNKRSGTVYTYDGLYLVNGMKYELGVAGNHVFKFLLQRMKNQAPLKDVGSFQVHTKSLPPCANRSVGPEPLMIEGPLDSRKQSNIMPLRSLSPVKKRSFVQGQLMVGRNALLNAPLHPIGCNQSSPHVLSLGKPQKEFTCLERPAHLVGNSNISSPCLIQVMMPAPFNRSLNLADLRNYTCYSSPLPGYGVPFFQGPLNKLSWTIPLSYGKLFSENEASSTKGPGNLLEYDVN